MYSNLLSLLIYITSNTTQINVLTSINKNENILRKNSFWLRIQVVTRCQGYCLFLYEVRYFKTFLSIYEAIYVIRLLTNIFLFILVGKVFIIEFHEGCKIYLLGEYWEVMEKDVRMTYTKKNGPITLFVQ